MIGRMALLGGMLVSGAAWANDSIAELGTGGLILSRTDAVSMEKEDLFISLDKVTVDYVFKNQSDKDVEAVVAFPMPDIDANPYSMPDLPDSTSDNFLGFEVKVDGTVVAPQLEQKAFAVGIEVTGELAKHDVPINPFTGDAIKALEKLSDEIAADWTDRGIIFVDSYDDGSGWKNVRTPLWTLTSTYWWRSTFPAGKAVEVHHTYRPSVGGTSGLTFFYDKAFQDPYQEYKAKYCIDDAFEKAIRRAAAQQPDGYPLLTEARIDYVLTSGGNWALGTIGDFTLTVDKGDPRNLVSFCGPNVRKTGPTTFVASEQQFYPARDVAVLILKPLEDATEASRDLAKPERALKGAAKALAERAAKNAPKAP